MVGDLVHFRETSTYICGNAEVRDNYYRPSIQEKRNNLRKSMKASSPNLSDVQIEAHLDTLISKNANLNTAS